MEALVQTCCLRGKREHFEALGEFVLSKSTLWVYHPNACVFGGLSVIGLIPMSILCGTGNLVTTPAAEG